MWGLLFAGLLAYMLSAFAGTLATICRIAACLAFALGLILAIVPLF
jgi:hypothetical protein